MKKSINPLDRIKIARPCAADWNEMLGDDRRRYCSRCRLNVYNLSNMTAAEAESLLIRSEGRVCVKIYRRADGTVLTRDCPEGWRALKRRVSRTATAAFALIAGFFGGTLGLGSLNALQSSALFRRVAYTLNAAGSVESPDETTDGISFGLYGALSNLPEIKAAILDDRR